MKYALPEEKGISSKKIKEYIEMLEENGLTTHDVIISVGDTVVYENYWKPFDENFMHRMYSVTKSVVAIAVGFLEQDGLLSLDDSMEKYFAAELEGQTDEYLRKQTVRDMLMMSTAKLERCWFFGDSDDRVKYYFENDYPGRPSGTIFQYDSSSAFILCALAERLTGMTMTDYLRIKMFDKIGVSKDVYCLKCPGGHSWGDSGFICTARDLLLIARFVMQKGNWNGEQILNEKYLTDATSALVDNDECGCNDFRCRGYGYYIWRFNDKAFQFSGMGCQYALCFPEKELILIYNGDNQGKANASILLLEKFHRMIENTMSDKPLAEDKEAYEDLMNYSKGLKLVVSKGKPHSEFMPKINNKWFKMGENQMNIEKFRLCFDEEGKGVFQYLKKGDMKEISFGMCENVSGIFPEEGYSDMVGHTYCPNHFYKCMVSASWTEERKLNIKLHIIDKYFGQLQMFVSFKNEKEAGFFMRKTAEDFLMDYDGYAGAVLDE